MSSVPLFLKFRMLMFLWIPIIPGRGISVKAPAVECSGVPPVQMSERMPDEDRFQQFAVSGRDLRLRERFRTTWGSPNRGLCKFRSRACRHRGVGLFAIHGANPASPCKPLRIQPAETMGPGGRPVRSVRRGGCISRLPAHTPPNGWTQQHISDRAISADLWPASPGLWMVGRRLYGNTRGLFGCAVHLRKSQPHGSPDLPRPYQCHHRTLAHALAAAILCRTIRQMMEHSIPMEQQMTHPGFAIPQAGDKTNDSIHRYQRG